MIPGKYQNILIEHYLALMSNVIAHPKQYLSSHNLVYKCSVDSDVIKGKHQKRTFATKCYPITYGSRISKLNQLN